MRIEVNTEPLHRQQSEAIVVPLFEEEQRAGRPWQGVDRALSGIISAILKSGEFKPTANATSVLHAPKPLPAERVVLLGLGKKDKVTPRTVCEAFGAAVKEVRKLKRKSIATFVPEASPAGDLASAIVEGTRLGQYEFVRYQTEKKDELPSVEHLIIAAGDVRQARRIESAARTGQIKAESVAFARDLQNLPGNELTPVHLADAADALASEVGLSCEVWDENDIARWGMHTILAVGQGSKNPPRIIILRHEPRRADVPTVMLVGKGITFDSGGISIKPGQGMEEMKMDMSGAATVIGAMKGIAQMKLPVRVWGIIPAAENMPGGNALKPGDIIKTYSGKTVEVTNTDAEGRLVLCDALAYAAEQKPDAILDLATLTGACIIALGHVAAGMMGNNDTLMDQIRVAADRTGDRVWPLPMWEEYNELVKSHVADLNNAGPSRIAGTICGAKFLEPFVGDIPWAHLDIAGTAWGATDTPTTPKNLGAGWGVRLLLQFLKEYKK